MSRSSRPESLDSTEYHRVSSEIVVKMLDLSIHYKSNLLRCVSERDEPVTEENTVFVSVFDYLHHHDWRVSIPEEISDENVKMVDRIRSVPASVDRIVDACQGSLLKEIDLVHQLNCELFFSRLDNFLLRHSPAYFYFENADNFHKAIARSDFSMAQEVPEKLKSDMEEHVKIRTLWAKRKNPKAHCQVIAVLHYDAMPKEIITFHSRTS